MSFLPTLNALCFWEQQGSCTRQKPRHATTKWPVWSVTE